MKMTWDILRRLFVWIFPMFVFDGCLNRDPHLEIDEHFTIGAISGGSPLYLSYRNRSARMSSLWRWELGAIADYKLADAAIIGSSPKGYFIADRHTGALKLFPSSKERDQVLRDEYQADPVNTFAPPSLLMWMKSRFLWPWIYLYYVACLLFIPWLSVRSQRRLTARLYKLPE